MATTDEAIDSMWIMLAAMLVFFMQAGFAMLEVGTVRSKNAQNILLKNLLDVSLGTILWWLLGYGFAYGESESDFIGSNKFATYKFTSTDYRDWFFQWAFAATAATIVSGALAERTQILAYTLFSCFITCWIYPLVVHWTWGGGWLADGGYVDFAGSGIVHMVGGVCALCGAIVVGPRIGRFELQNNCNEFKPHNMPLVILGTFILWFGWYGFNAGSTLAFTGDNVGSAALVAVNTSIAAAAGGLTVLIIKAIVSKFGPSNILHYDVPAMSNGILAGLVSITAGCADIEPYGAFVMGILGGWVYYMCSSLVSYNKIDDPLDAFAVHGGAGMWGVFALGFFHTTNGVFYGGSGDLLAWQLAGIATITAWSAFWALLIFYGLKICGWLRITEEQEKLGIDHVEHGGHAYHINISNNEVEMKCDNSDTKV